MTCHHDTLDIKTLDKSERSTADPCHSPTSVSRSRSSRQQSRRYRPSRQQSRRYRPSRQQSRRYTPSRQQSRRYRPSRQQAAGTLDSTLESTAGVGLIQPHDGCGPDGAACRVSSHATTPLCRHSFARSSMLQPCLSCARGSAPATWSRRSSKGERIQSTYDARHEK